MVVSSKELNSIIYRYLMEAGRLQTFQSMDWARFTYLVHFLGFLHTSYTFGHESLLVHDGNFVGEGHTIASGTLVNLVHKGLKLLEIEAHLKEVCGPKFQFNYF